MVLAPTTGQGMFLLLIIEEWKSDMIHLFSGLVAVAPPSPTEHLVQPPVVHQPVARHSHHAYATSYLSAPPTVSSGDLVSVPEVTQVSYGYPLSSLDDRHSSQSQAYLPPMDMSRYAPATEYRSYDGEDVLTQWSQSLTPSPLAAIDQYVCCIQFLSARAER